MLRTRFSLRLFLYFAVLSFPSTLTRKTPPQQDAAFITLYCWDGIVKVMSSAWFPPYMLGTEVH